MIPETNFFIQLMKNLKLNVSILHSDEVHDDIDLNFRSAFFTSFEGSDLCDFILNHIKDKNIYFVTDAYHCKYICLLVPDIDSDRKIIIGPYLDMKITQDLLLKIMEFYHIPSSLDSSLKKYYDLVPIITNGSYLNAIVYTFADTLWDNSRHYQIESILLDSEEQEYFTGDAATLAQSSSKIDIETIEKLYKTENEMLQIITMGQIHKLEQYLKNTPPVMPIENRNPDPLRNAKNYMIISNSIFRKAAEAGGVHPYYINEISSSFALKIEAINSIHDINSFAFSMMRKYCLLVHNNSTSQYSPIIQQLIVLIDSDLSADLSLNTLATSVNVNASYLSSLFKKDTGITLTAYVTKKRIEYAILLLNTSELQIQSIATYCGIPDLNYFTKIFKKTVGVTPSQYRRDIHAHS
ncbi:MAG: AraC family transcriptional regulator [Lachnospira sp.]|nr:AraC family transcriptional regulator [Lachnospira sp.]